MQKAPLRRGFFFCLENLGPHPEEARSGVSKDDPECTGDASPFETDLKVLLRVRL
jgi:hypothetical protein